MSELEEHFAGLVRLFGMPEPVREYVFAPPRRWRFDFAFPEQRVAVEIDGGQWAPGGGRHAKDADKDKHNAAVLLGWRVLRFSGEMINNDPDCCLRQLQALLCQEAAR